MHVDLSRFQPGAYVVISDIPTWDVVRKAYQFFGLDDEERKNMLLGPEGDEFIKAIFESMIDEWNLKDRKGNMVPFTPGATFPVANMGRNLDGRIVATIFQSAQQVISGGGNDDPNVDNA